VRIVSLLPSATEIVCALGAGAELVGRSEECDYPPEVRALPVVMRARTIDANGSSAAIDHRVRESRAAGESLYTLEVDRLRTLHPELLLTQDLCGVCSVTGDQVAAACSAAGIRPSILSVSPRTLEEVWQSIERIGAAIGKSDIAERLATRLRERSAPGGPRGRGRVAVVEWLDPPILAGLWTPSMIRAAGAEPLGPPPGEDGRRTSWADLAELAPDLVVLSPCSFPVERSLAELRDGPLGRAVGSLPRTTRVWVADEAYFSRPGPRLADGVALLDGLLGGAPRAYPMPAVRWTPPEVAA